MLSVKPARCESKRGVDPRTKSKVEIISGTPEEAAATLVEKLRKEAKVL
jgi:electron transfer flavoprotein alpha/beta subunit